MMMKPVKFADVYTVCMKRNNEVLAICATERDAIEYIDFYRDFEEDPNDRHNLFIQKKQLITMKDII